MKVIFITNNSKLYGANLSTFHLMLDLKEKYGIQVFAVVREKGDLTEQFESHMIPYYQCAYAADIVQKGEKNLRTYLHYFKTNIIAFFKIRKAIKQIGGADIIHSATSVIDIGHYLSKFLKIAHVWHVRENGEHYNFEFIWKDSVIRKRYRSTAAVIAISQYIQDVLRQRWNQVDNVIRIYNGVEQDRKFLPEDKSYCRNASVHFCVVGLVCEAKNQFAVVKACRMLVETGITAFDLTIVGSGKQELQRIEQYIFEHHLESYVKCIGYCHDVYSILRTMDVGIMASSDEAFGRATIEYMMHCMPVIANNSGANPELVQENSNGFLFDVHSIEEIAKQMEYFIKHQQEISRMGKNAYEFSIHNFTKEQNTEQIYALYRKICNI